MSQDLIGLSDLVTLNSAGIADIAVTELLQHAPVLAALAADTASHGTKHEYLKEVGAPVVGFRDPNTGREWDHSSDELVTINLKILDASMAVDKSIADAYQKGGAQALIALEAKRHLKAAFFGVERQFFLGAAEGDANGFVGFPDAETLNYLQLPMVVNAGGTEGQSSVLSSVYAIRSTQDMSDAVTIIGQSGEITIGESVIVAIPELLQGSPTSKTYPGYYTPITGWIGLQLGSTYSVGRLANVDATSHTLTDDMLSQLLERFPANRPPTMFVMSVRSRGQLQRSRTTYSPTGAEAPLPATYQGIPIVVTEGVTNTETEVEVDNR